MTGLPPLLAGASQDTVEDARPGPTTRTFLGAVGGVAATTNSGSL